MVFKNQKLFFNLLISTKVKNFFSISISILLNFEKCRKSLIFPSVVVERNCLHVCQVSGVAKSQYTKIQYSGNYRSIFENYRGSSHIF